MLPSILLISPPPRVLLIPLSQITYLLYCIVIPLEVGILEVHGIYSSFLYYIDNVVSLFS